MSRCVSTLGKARRSSERISACACRLFFAGAGARTPALRWAMGCPTANSFPPALSRTQVLSRARRCVGIRWISVLLCSTAPPAPAPYPARALQKQLHYHPSPIRASARWITRPLDRATAPRHYVSQCCCCCIARRLAGAAAAVVVKERPVGAGMATMMHWVREQLDTSCGGYVEP